MSRLAELCQYDLPSGRLCRQVALKNEQVCRHHIRLYRHKEAQMLHNQAMQSFASELNSLDTPTLLHVLRLGLNRIERRIRYLPEAHVALRAVLHRLESQPAPSQAGAQHETTAK